MDVHDGEAFLPKIGVVGVTDMSIPPSASSILLIIRERSISIELTISSCGEASQKKGWI
jgi:hypothetical protein